MLPTCKTVWCGAHALEIKITTRSHGSRCFDDDPKLNAGVRLPAKLFADCIYASPGILSAAWLLLVQSSQSSGVQLIQSLVKLPLRF